MAAESPTHLELEIGHVLFIDIVGYSKLLITEQTELLRKLTAIEIETEQVRLADAQGKLIRLPTGDGMALVFRSSPAAPAQCALELSKQLKSHPELRLRMGIHSGPVNEVTDVNGRTNITGAGINIAQRVMDCGDAGHILLSRHLAEDLEQYPQWREHLHDLGQVEVKHGAKIDVVNFYNDEAGNAELPEKFKQATREEKTKAHLLVSTRRRKRIVVGASLFLAIALSIVLSIFFHRSKIAQEALPVSDKSIAVLPFENLSMDEENAFFAGGVQDEILTDLARVADLKVISRTSVMKYKSGPERNLPEIAKALGVSHVVEGSVQRAGGRVRVNVQLIDARNDAHLWAENYDRDFADIFAIQTEIAEKIADQLRAKLSTEEKTAIAERPTADLVAYAYYTKARELDTLTNWEGDEKNLKQEVELFEKSIQRDPNFVLAYCALAKAQIDLALMIGQPDNHLNFELAKKAAESAARLRPDLGEAHLALARYYFNVGVGANDYNRAREELAIVRAKLPNNSEALWLGAMIGRHQNRWDVSLADLRKASELDPQNGDWAYQLRRIYFEMRRYSESEQVLMEEAATRKGENPWNKTVLAESRLAQGDPVAAQSLMEQVPLEFSPHPYIWNTRFRVALYLHDYDTANRVIAALPAKWADFAFGGLSDWAYGQVARARGDQQKALAAFAAARKKEETKEATSGYKPEEDAGYLADIAKFDAGLGRKEEAIREAQRAVELMPIAKESLNGPLYVTDLALVYAWTGERDRALQQLQIVATIPNGPSYGDLKFNPCWDSLRDDKRFDKIVAAAKAASR